MGDHVPFDSTESCLRRGSNQNQRKRTAVSMGSLSDPDSVISPSLSELSHSSERDHNKWLWSGLISTTSYRLCLKGPEFSKPAGGPPVGQTTADTITDTLGPKPSGLLSLVPGILAPWSDSFPRLQDFKTWEGGCLTRFPHVVVNRSSSSHRSIKK